MLNVDILIRYQNKTDIMYDVPTSMWFVGTRYISSALKRLPDYFVNHQYPVPTNNQQLKTNNQKSPITF